MPNPNPNPNPDAAPLTYRDAAGSRHRVVVRERTDGAWQVLDVTVIETLRGTGDDRDAAEALARDYAQQHDHPPARASRRAAAHRAAA